MKEKLLAIWSKVKPCLLKAYEKAPFLCGVVVGYIINWLF